MLSPRVFDLDVPAEIERIGRRLRAIVGGELRRRGAVLGLSGGVDSAVCAALAARALGPGRVLGLLMPERESSPASTRLGRRVAESLGIECLEQDITPALEAVGCYATRDAAVRTLFPDYAPDWKCKIVVRGGPTGRLNYFDLVVRAPDGTGWQRRLGPRAYLRIVAATNYKQRIRKAVEYHHADCRVYAVLGTPNRLEYDQGFFVKNGDGAADVKPIAHLYKSQVYALAQHLDLPEEVRGAAPTTDTYSLEQGQDEFFFALPWAAMDLALWAHDHGVPAAQLGHALGLAPAAGESIYRDIAGKRSAAVYLKASPRLIDPPAGE